MKIFYDTEFLENGTTVRLISIGMVAEDGRKYYAVVQDLNLMEDVSHHTWLRENVFPFLPVSHIDNLGAHWNPKHEDYKNIKSRKVIAKEIRKFVADTPNPEFWAWYGAYDHIALAQLYGTMMDLPSDFPMWTNDIRQELHLLGNPRYPAQVSGHHNALADAEWNKELLEYLLKLDGPPGTTVGWS